MHFTAHFDIYNPRLHRAQYSVNGGHKTALGDKLSRGDLLFVFFCGVAAYGAVVGEFALENEFSLFIVATAAAAFYAIFPLAYVFFAAGAVLDHVTGLFGLDEIVAVAVLHIV